MSTANPPLEGASDRPAPCTLFELPQDILDLIFPYLPPKSFLALCSVNKEVYDRYNLDPLYWRIKTSETFRLPISPLLHADGARWAWLYKKLRTQTRPFTWGQGVNGGLGPSAGLRNIRNRFSPRGIFHRTSSPWPTEVHVPEEMGTIVDLQCGGWSTNILTNEGKLFTVGIIDAANGRHLGSPVELFTPLQKFGQYTVTGVRQFSAGRRHILGLDDHGYVWSWDRVDQLGSLISFQNGLDHAHRTTRVVAGWNESSAYIPGRGIIYWTIVKTPDHPLTADYDRVVNDTVVPGTAYSRNIPSSTLLRQDESDSATSLTRLKEEEIGEVLVHIVLEGYIVFITGLSKIFACRVGEQRDTEKTPEKYVFEVPGYSSTDRVLKDLQGSFRTFAVFTGTGEVLAGNKEYLDSVFANIRAPPSLDKLRLAESSPKPGPDDILSSRPLDIPALQRTGVIALAFGDYHFHALHANGTITAYGREPSCCGALGLGGTNAGSRFRGVKTGRTPMNRDAILLPVAAKRGRQVWFEHEKKDWLQWMEDWIRTPTAFPHFPEVFAVLNDQEDKQAAFSEWVEQEGRHWHDGIWAWSRSRHEHDGGHGNAQHDSSANPETESLSTEAEAGYQGLGAYFAISVAAAGWHTGALVLVDDETAEKTRQKWIADEGTGTETGKIKGEYVWEKMPFPRIKLPDGYEFPGEGKFREWREGMPSQEDLANGNLEW